MFENFYDHRTCTDKSSTVGGAVCRTGMTATNTHTQRRKKNPTLLPLGYTSLSTAGQFVCGQVQEHGHGRRSVQTSLTSGHCYFHTSTADTKNFVKLTRPRCVLHSPQAQELRTRACLSFGSPVWRQREPERPICLQTIFLPKRCDY